MHACSVPPAGVRRRINEISDHSRPSPENNASLGGEDRYGLKVSVRSDVLTAGTLTGPVCMEASYKGSLFFPYSRAAHNNRKKKLCSYLMERQGRRSLWCHHHTPLTSTVSGRANKANGTVKIKTCYTAGNEPMTFVSLEAPPTGPSALAETWRHQHISHPVLGVLDEAAGLWIRYTHTLHW